MVCFCIRLNPDGVVAVKFLFGIPDDTGEEDSVPHENLSYIHELTSMLNTMAADHIADSDTQTPLHQV